MKFCPDCGVGNELDQPKYTTEDYNVYACVNCRQLHEEDKWLNYGFT